MTDFFNLTGELFQKSFKILPLIGNSYNYFMIAGGFVGLFIWLRMQVKYNAEAKKNGTLK